MVLVEDVWTLRSAFAQDMAAQLLAVRSILDETAFAFEDRAAVERAVTLFEQGSCGLSDCLVVAKEAGRGCEFTAAFDRSMRKLPGAYFSDRGRPFQSDRGRSNRVVKGRRQAPRPGHVAVSCPR